MSLSDAEVPRPADPLAPRRVHPDSPAASRRPVPWVVSGLAVLAGGVVVAANLFGTFGEPQGGWSVLVPQTAVPAAATPTPGPLAVPSSDEVTPSASAPASASAAADARDERPADDDQAGRPAASGGASIEWDAHPGAGSGADRRADHRGTAGHPAATLGAGRGPVDRPDGLAPTTRTEARVCDHALGAC